MLIKAKFLPIIALIFSALTLSGENYHEEIAWLVDDATKSINASDAIDFHGSIHLEQFNNLPLFRNYYKLDKTGELLVEITNARFRTQNFKDDYNISLITDQVQILSEIVLERGKPEAQVTLLPFRLNAMGEIEKLISFDLEIHVRPLSSRSIDQREYADESVLRSGTWHKAKIQNDGIFQITPNWLNDNGMGSNLNINKIRVFGNGGKRLSEIAGENLLDDLLELPLRLFDQNNNGVFDGNDYALFYGQGIQPVLHNEELNKLYHDVNVYGHDSYYFISTDLSGNGKRMDVVNSSNATPTIEVNTFHDYWFHENEWVNLLRTGQRWYGEDFHNTPNRSFGFNRNNVVLGSTAIFTSAAAVNASRNSGNSQFNFNINGELVHTTLHQAINTTSLSFRYADRQEQSTDFVTNSNDFNINVNFVKSISSALGWMDYIAVQLERELVLSDDFITIQNLDSYGVGSIAAFNFSGNTSAHEVWDITNMHDAHALNIQNNRFVIPAETLSRLIAFRTNQQFSQPTYVGQIGNQNLHALGQRDAIIITDGRWVDAANELGEFHLSKEDYSYHVVDITHVANEFASGQMDIAAVRDFVKMFYDRANGVESLMPKSVVIFGDGTFDYKSIMVEESSNTNFVPLFTTLNAEHTGNSYPTDDFYGLLDDGEGNVRSGRLEVGVGRIPCKNAEEANRFVDKIKHYYSSPSLGPWRNIISLIADDEDTNTHLNDGENHSNTIEQLTSDYNLEKIYFDSYRQESTPGGDRYPDVNRAIINRANSGAVFMNYIGHGGEGGWAHERVLDQQTINNFNNLDNMPVWVTATCSFGKMDDPDIISGGESLVLNPAGGAVTAVTTTRLVNSSSNERINRNFLLEAISNEESSLGEIFRLAKNLTGLDGNSNKFALLGDPMLAVAFPKYDVFATTLNSQPITNSDTIKALQHVRIGGVVKDLNGQIMTDFNGIVFPTLFDKKSIVTTIVNDPGSREEDFEVQNNILYRGRASVVNGEFEFEFVVPKDITYAVGPGKLSLYAHDFNEDANGFDKRILIGGTSDDIEEDNIGPEISIYLDSENFVSGDETGTDPLLIANLFDDSGINTTGNGLGHDITLVFDDNSQNTIVLNEFYEGELDNFQKGNLNYLLNQLEVGPHTLTLKAWDVHNNSSEARLDFVVTDDKNIKLTHVLNYPNPFTSNTNFQFEHNVPGESLEVSIEIFTVSGRLIKTIRKEILTNSNRVADINWDGKDDYGDSIGKGVYVYKLKVRTPSNTSAYRFEKLVILK